MNFDTFLLALPKIKNMSLPGQEAQFKMSPPFREELLEQFKHRIKDAKRAGVMALFYPGLKNDTKFVLILRKTYNGVHSAQIGFPGGKLENQDNSLQDAAVRETEEEIGVLSSAIDVVKELTETYIPPSNFYVKPFLGICHEVPIFKKDDDEVQEIVEVHLTDFLDDNKVISKRVSTSYGKKIEVPAFDLNGHIVWGATAMMLSEVRVLLKSAL
jgi:8-oxo-dGTP pyrophosphatase MutT (NUDIX family)